jgi:hypothetical protein
MSSAVCDAAAHRQRLTAALPSIDAALLGSLVLYTFQPEGCSISSQFSTGLLPCVFAGIFITLGCLHRRGTFGGVGRIP